MSGRSLPSFRSTRRSSSFPGKTTGGTLNIANAAKLTSQDPSNSSPGHPEVRPSCHNQGGLLTESVKMTDGPNGARGEKFFKMSESETVPDLGIADGKFQQRSFQTRRPWRPRSPPAWFVKLAVCLRRKPKRATPVSSLARLSTWPATLLAGGRSSPSPKTRR